MGGITVIVFIFAIIFIFLVFGELYKNSPAKPNSNFTEKYTVKEKKKEIKKVDEVYGDIEDVWAKFDEETEKRNNENKI